MGIPAAATLILACYTLGCITPSYYAVKWLTGRDLRSSGSGNVGATNAGRILGRKAYIALALLDILKGWAGPAITVAAGLAGWWPAAAGMAVTAGHLWPVQLGFRGGKGMATAYGVILAFSPWAGLAMWAIFLPARTLLHRTTPGAVLAFLCAPLLLWVCSAGPAGIATASVLAAVVTLTHRRNLQDAHQRRAQRSTPQSPPTA